MTLPSYPLPHAPTTPGRRRFRQRRGPSGIWYFVITVMTAGALAAVPFWHAWSRLRRPALRKTAVIYTVVDLLLVRLADSRAIGGVLVLAVIIVACLQLRGIRHEVYGSPRPAVTDPAVARTSTWASCSSTCRCPRGFSRR